MKPIDFDTMPVYVINLDRRKDRWTEFLQQPVLKEFQGLERFSAVDGKMLDWENDNRISVHTRDNIRKNFRRSHYEINTVGACGATFSHVGCWEKFLKTDSEYCMVLEDDINFTKKDLEKAEILAKRIPENFDVWILGHHYGARSIQWMPKSPWYIVNQFTGAHCYIITRKAAKIFLEECFPVETHIEFYMTSTAKQKKLFMFRNINLRVQQMAESTLGNDSDTFGGATCPLCRVPDNPTTSFFLWPIKSVFQAMAAIAAVGFVGYGYARRQCSV